MPDAPLLSVVVPFHNAGHDLAGCLEHLAASGFQPYECLLIDDGSTDPAEFHEAPLPVQVHRIASNRGPAVARNLGARMAQGEILVFLDADVQVHEDTLGRIAARFRDDPRLDAVFGSYDDSPAAPSVISQFRNLLHCYTHQSSPRRARTFWAGCGAIRRTVFLNLGGFPERYSRPSIEDIEFGARASAAGVVIEIDPDIQVQHRKEWTLAGMCRTDIARRGVPWTRLLLERRDIPNQLSLRHGQRFSVLLTGMALCLLPWAGRHWVFPMLAVLCLALVLFLNRGFYRFLERRRGWPFTAVAFALHLLYFVNCGLAALLGMGAYVAGRLKRPASGCGAGDRFVSPALGGGWQATNNDGLPHSQK